MNFCYSATHSYSSPSSKTGIIIKLGDIAAKITSSLRKQTWGPSFSGSIWLESFMWFKYIPCLNLTNTFLDKVCLWKLVGVQAIILIFFIWRNLLFFKSEAYFSHSLIIVFWFYGTRKKLWLCTWSTMQKLSTVVNSKPER